MTDKQAHAVAAAAAKAYPLLVHNRQPAIIALIDALHATMRVETVCPFTAAGEIFNRGDVFPVSRLDGQTVRGLLLRGDIRIAPEPTR